MKKENLAYIYAGILILGAIFAIYLFNLRLTGFAVFQEDFAGGEYVNTSYNGSIVVLNENQTSGVYTSRIYNANESVKWNNLTWQGQGTLNFEVRSCSSSDCANSSFATADLNNLNLSGQYFQYKVSFAQSPNLTTLLNSVSFDYSTIASSTPVNVTLTLYSPSGELTSRTNVPIKFSTTGSGVECKYNVKDSSGAEVKGNTTLADCANSTFNVDGDGDYVFTIYANNSYGAASQSSAFLVSTPAEKKKEKELPPEEETPPVEVPQEVPKVVELSLQNIEASTLNPSDSKDLNLVVKNTGTASVNGCGITPAGDFASWLSIPEDTKNFNPGDEKNFSFSVNVPENAEELEYTLSLSLQCIETLKSSEFLVQVVKKRFTFNLADVQRTSTDNVRVTYSLAELLNEEQILSLKFSLFDTANQEVASISENQTLAAGESDEFRTDIPINESLEGNLTLSVDLNSERYSSSVSEPIVLGAPIGGFAIFGEGGLGTGGILVVLVVFVILVAIFFVVRKMKSSGKTLKDLFSGDEVD